MRFVTTANSFRLISASLAVLLAVSPLAPLSPVAPLLLASANAQETHNHGTSQSHSQSEGHHQSIELSEPWTRATPPSAQVAGGYIMISNTGKMADRLIGGSAAFAERVEIHEMSMVNDVMKMRPLEAGLEIAPGDMATLQPGGYHLMFMGLKEGLKAGEMHQVTLTFEHAGDIEAMFSVAEMGAQSSGHQDHMSGDNHMQGHDHMKSDKDNLHEGHGG